MKGIDVLFHMVYGSLMCSKEALSDRPKWEGCLQTPEMLTVRSSKQNSPVLMWKREFQRLSACHLAVCWSWAGYRTSFERGDSGLPADIRIRTIVQLIGILWSYFEHFWGLANILNILVCYSVTPCARLCTIHQLKGNMLSIHMRYSSLLSTKRLQRYYSILIHIQAGLVY